MIRLALLSSVAMAAALPATGQTVFDRIAAFATPDNMAEGQDRTAETSAEIISASDDGMTLVYSDSPLGVLGFVDITDPANPAPLGSVAMDGEPTTAVIIGDRVFAGVDTSDSFTEPSGQLRVLDLDSRILLSSCDLGGQPDSVARAPDGSVIAVAIENQRDEDLADGALPQLPAGYVVTLAVTDGAVDCNGQTRIDLTGLAEIGGEDPEPEYVDINDASEIVVTMQENNHIAIIGADGTVSSHFSAGTVSLDGIDIADDGALTFDGALADLPREPDGVQWLDADHIVTANEGDYQGGSRGWTIFRRDGTVVFDSGADFDHAVAAVGHYPDNRSDAKGSEPESVEVARFGGVPYVFVMSERGSVIGVYDVTDPAAPRLTQMLPSGVSPEGIVAIPDRDLLVTANETDLGEDGGPRAHVMVFRAGAGDAAYPMITADGSQAPIGWGALSGLAAGPDAGQLFAVSDSAYADQPAMYAIDAAQKPARITGKTVITRDGAPATGLDLEGITPDGQGGFWLASEGDPEEEIPHRIVQVDAQGAIQAEITLPEGLLAQQTRFGLEGIALHDGTLWMAVQREWGDDAPGQVKLLAYDLADESWGAVAYPLEAPADGGWVGLSEIAIHGDWAYLVERDNRVGDAAALKALYRVPLAELVPADLDGPLPVVTKTLVRDLIPDLRATGGYVVDKVEGFAVDADGQGWFVTDNDATDDSSGETVFWSMGPVADDG